MSKYIRVIFAIFISTLLFSCAEHIVESTPSILDTQNENKVFAKFSSIQSKVFSVSCTLSGCHGDVAFPNLSAGSAYNNIVNKVSSSGQDLIEPGDAENSYLFLKITGAPGIFGERMPRGRDPLAPSVVDSIRVWINNGALNN